MSSRKLARALVCAGLVFSTAQFTLAIPITFIVEGNVNIVSNELTSAFSIGDLFHLEYTFESTTPDSNPSNIKRGFYNNAITSLSVTVGGYSASGIGVNRISVDNDLTGADKYRIDITTPLSGNSVNGFDISTQTPILQMRDTTLAAFSNDLLPVSSLDPNDFLSGGGGTFLALEFTKVTDDDLFPEGNLAFISANVTTFYVRAVPETSTIALDIKPGSDHNSVSLKSKGVLPVAILSTDDFDVHDVDINTLLFGDPLLLDNGGTAVRPLRSAFEDVSGDGLLDLSLKFSMAEIVEFQALGPDSIEGLLTGETLDGTPFAGTDLIRIVPNP